jgi:twitching motility protein PilT
MMAEEAASKKPMLGEVLVAYGIITRNMLKNALRRQSQVGGQIGSILIEMGYVTTDMLLDFLGRQFGVPAVNLFNIDIPANILKLMPLETIKEYKVLPLEIDNRLTLAMVNPHDHIAIRDIEFILGRPVDTVVVPSRQFDAALRSIQEKGVNTFRGCEIEHSCESLHPEGPFSISTLLRKLKESHATDLQLTAGVPPSLKMGTELQRLNMPPLTPDVMKEFAQVLMTPEQQSRFAHANDLDFAYTDAELGRFRVNGYRQRNSVSLTIRGIPDAVPTLRGLGLPDEFENFALRPQGLILISGPAGQGKSTTMAALLDIINTRRRCNIVTLEDPIEYLHRHKNSNVNQREIGIDTASFHDGLKHIFRQDPDVIVIGEMRDPESFRIAIQAAETGHLVMSTLHSRNATSTIERIIDTFPADQQAQIRTQLADSFLLVISQRLVLKKDRSGPVLAYEKLVNSFKVRNFIREGKTHQIRSQMQLPGEEYSSIDASLARLALEGLISPEEGARHADNLLFYQGAIRGKVPR